MWLGDGQATKLLRRELKSLISTSSLRPSTKKWATTQVAKANRNSIQKWTYKLRNLGDSTLKNKKELAKFLPTEKRVTFKLYQGPVLDINKWSSKFPGLSWAKYGGEDFGEEGLERDVIVPAWFFNTTLTSMVDVYHNTKVSGKRSTVQHGQGRFVRGVQNKDDPTCYLARLEKVCSRSGEVEALGTAVISESALLEIVRVSDNPVNQSPLRAPTRRPMADGLQYLSSPWLHTTLKEFRDFTGEVISNAVVYRGDCVPRGLIAAVGNRISSHVPDGPAKKTGRPRNPPFNERTIFELAFPGRPYDPDNIPPMSWENLLPVLMKFRIPARGYYESGRPIPEARYDPPGRGICVTFCYIMKNDHAFHVKRESCIKALEEHEHREHVKPPQSVTITTGKPVKFAGVARTVDELLEMIDEDLIDLAETEEDSEYKRVRIYWAGSLTDALKELVLRNLMPNNVHQGKNGEITRFDFAHIEGITVRVCSISAPTFAQIDRANLSINEANEYIENQHKFFKCSSSNFVSEYNGNFLDVFRGISIAPRRMRFEPEFGEPLPEGHQGPELPVVSLDFSSSYPSILSTLTHVPVFFDGFEPYDGHTPEPWTMYVHRPDTFPRFPSHPEWKQFNAMYPSDVELSYGQFLTYREHTTIVVFCRPYKLVPADDYRTTIDEIRQSDLPKQSKKTILNSGIGVLGRSSNEKNRLFPATTYDDALELAEEHGGRPIIYRTEYISSDDEVGPIAQGEYCLRLKPGTTVWGVETRERRNMTCGFLPIQLWIYNKQRRLVVDLMTEVGTDNVVGLHTDSLKVKPTFQHKFPLKADDSIPGQVYDEGFKRFECALFEGVRVTGFEVPLWKPVEQEVVTDPARFEAALNQPCVQINGAAGTGKSTLVKKHLVETGQEAIWVCPNNAMAHETGGITVHNLCGKYAAKERLRGYRPYRTPEVLVFEEDGQWTSSHTVMVKEYLRRYCPKQIIRLGDPLQIKPTEDHVVGDYVDQYRRRSGEMATTRIELTTNHRQTDGEERRDDVHVKNLPIEDLLDKYCTNISNAEALKLSGAFHMSYTNAVVDYVNANVHRGPEYYKGLKLRYISSAKLGKGDTAIHKDYVLEVVEASKTHVTLRDPLSEHTHEPFDIDFVRVRFTYDYCRTGHKAQGKTLEVPVVIWHPFHERIKADRNWLYVALTRTRDGVPIYWTGKPPSTEVTKVKEKQQILKAIHGYNTQDRKKGRTNNLTYENVLSLLEKSEWRCWAPFKDCCNVCEPTPYGRTQMSSWTLDRINSSKAHNIENLRVCCLQCNARKGKKRVQ